MSRFLLAHPDASVLREVERALSDQHHDLRSAKDGLDAIDRALDEKPDAVILGVDLHGLSGLDAARALRALEPTKRIPILFIAENARQALAVNRSGLSLVNCVIGPLDAAQLQEQAERLLHARPQPANHHPANGDEHLHSIIDPVTGLYARHYLLHRLAYEAARSARYHVPLSCILFGVNDFEALVEGLGKARGDRLLIEIAGVFRHSARVSDIVGRAGEDEFLMITPHTDEGGARVSAERLQRLVGEMKADLPPPHSRVSFSCGIAGAPGSSLADNLALLGRAEGALLIAREGQEKIVVG